MRELGAELKQVIESLLRHGVSLLLLMTLFGASLRRKAASIATYLGKQSKTAITQAFKFVNFARALDKFIVPTHSLSVALSSKMNAPLF